ncbi:MAG: helix-turn-helix transcriptional regulator [Acidimicrobiales bacterium]
MVIATTVCRHPVGALTARQRQVLSLVAEGWSNAAIAAKLTISERAVVSHTSNIYDSLGIFHSPDGHRRVLAALAYLNR